ncbi:MAG TPA: hypothetical protein VMD59_15315 [Acidimicrobiales bacterium]|nr:hypothetical protein [Acidimicrobiales bacterium]
MSTAGGGQAVHLERLGLRVAGLDEDAARQLAALVAAGLAPALRRASGEAGLGALAVEVTSPPGGAGVETLARRVVDDVVRALARQRLVADPQAPGGGSA